MASFVLGESSSQMLHLAQTCTAAGKNVCAELLKSFWIPPPRSDSLQIISKALESPIEHEGMQLVAFSGKNSCLGRFSAIYFNRFLWGFYVEQDKQEHKVISYQKESQTKGTMCGTSMEPLNLSL